MNFVHVFKLLVPEVALSALAFSVLLTDLLRRGRGTVEHRHEVLGRWVLMGLILVAGLYAWQLLTWQNTFVIGNGAFVACRLNTLFKLTVMGLAFVTVMIGLKTPFSTHVGEYYALILFSIIGMEFLISSEDLLMIFVSLEMVSLTLYVLTAIQKGVRRSVEAGLKYFIFGGLSAAFLLFGLSYIFGATGHTSLKDIAAALEGGSLIAVPFKMLNLGILFALVGLGFKIAAVPFHLWAPDAYEGAPTPVAALIATGSKVASFVALTKLLLWGLPSVAGSAVAWPSAWKQGWSVPVLFIAVLSMGLGNLAAISQRNVKRLLAYSSVAHAGYILVAMVAITALGLPARDSVPAIFFYVIIYAVTNIGAFGVVNVLASRAGGDDFVHFIGMSRKAPFLSLLMLIFVLSLAGIPPLAGFFGKFYLFAAAVQADPGKMGLLWLVAFAIAMSAVSLYYYLKLIKQMYVLPSSDMERLPMCRSTCTVLGCVCIVVFLLGLFPSRVMGTLQHLSDRKSGDPVWAASQPVQPVIRTIPPAPDASSAETPSASAETQ